MQIIKFITDLFLASPLLLLFTILGLGHMVGKLRIGSFSLGVSAILFVGIGLSALHPNLKLPEIVYELGLVLFVYTVGLASGPAFFGSFRRNGLRDNVMGITLLLIAGCITYAFARGLHLGAPIAAGLFAGSLTNTPALAGVVEALKTQTATLASTADISALLAEPVIGYSLAYPFGVIGVILAIHLFSRLFRVDFNSETSNAKSAYPLAPPNSSIYVISHHHLAGRPVNELEQENEITIAHIRRGDVWFAPQADTLLQVGDQVIVQRNGTSDLKLRTLFGNSMRELSETDLPSTALGIAVGLLVGLIAIPLPGGVIFRLGFAGGPLLVALVLGYVGRLGPIVWQMPYSVNQTLRHLGIVLFLAGIGSRAGYSFASTLRELGPTVVVAGAVITFTYSALTLILGYKVFKMPMSVLSGLLAGLQTQPAVLAYATEKSSSEAPNIGYATVYPTAMVAKIILAQVLLSLLL